MPGPAARRCRRLPPAGREVGSAPGPGSISITRSVRVVGVFIDDDHKALARGVIAPDAGVIGTAEPVIRGVEESLEHHGVRYAGEFPLGITL
jgi:hypothetical protein